jgi:hypothetical protein
MSKIAQSSNYLNWTKPDPIRSVAAKSLRHAGFPRSGRSVLYRRPARIRKGQSLICRSESGPLLRNGRCAEGGWGADCQQYTNNEFCLAEGS